MGYIHSGEQNEICFFSAQNTGYSRSSCANIIIKSVAVKLIKQRFCQRIRFHCRSIRDIVILRPEKRLSLGSWFCFVCSTKVSGHKAMIHYQKVKRLKKTIKNYVSMRLKKNKLNYTQRVMDSVWIVYG